MAKIKVQDAVKAIELAAKNAKFLSEVDERFHGLTVAVPCHVGLLKEKPQLITVAIVNEDDEASLVVFNRDLAETIANQMLDCVKRIDELGEDEENDE